MQHLDMTDTPIKRPGLKAIWAQSIDGIIGTGTDMPWHLPEDLQHFKETTSGHDVLMGRKTWESIPPRFRPLPGRRNIVLSSSPAGQWSQGAEVVTDYSNFDGWVIGGGSVYAATLALVQHIELTLIDLPLAHKLGEQAVYAPDIADFEVVSDSDWLVSKTGLRYKFQSLRRKQ
ncbi:putative folate reductase [Corynebacterium kutscheri]|uniref:dihydrofolate reductase n=2 Tax=Corynebacterium kutscheri TaxID=35755 RepID=A0AB38VQB7_9CORY|nr:putative folate reductase [Corynebacterium kutscheri]